MQNSTFETEQMMGVYGEITGIWKMVVLIEAEIACSYKKAWCFLA